MIRIRLREVLDERGMTQKELAERTGLRPNTVSMLCRDAVTAISKDTLSRIMKALDIRNVSEIIEYVSDE